MSANLSQRCSSHCNTKQCKLDTRKCDAAKEGKYACLDTGKMFVVLPLFQKNNVIIVVIQLLVPRGSLN
jgi:hypothetical protein